VSKGLLYLRTKAVAIYGPFYLDLDERFPKGLLSLETWAVAIKGRLYLDLDER